MGGKEKLASAPTCRMNEPTLCRCPPSRRSWPPSYTWWTWLVRRGRGPDIPRASPPSAAIAAAAGSERLKKTQEPGAEGEELSRESMHINRSLSYLEQVGERG